MKNQSQTKESALIEDLIGSASAGDRVAQERLMKIYWPDIVRAVRKYKARVGGLAQREQTNDLCQEAAMRILDKLPRAEWQGQGAFLAWIRVVAQARAADMRKFHAAQKRAAKADTGVEHGDVAPPTRSPESRLDAKNKLRALESSLHLIKPEYADAVRYHHMGYSHEEIGEKLGCTTEAARKLVARGHAQLIAIAR